MRRPALWHLSTTWCETRPRLTEAAEQKLIQNHQRQDKKARRGDEPHVERLPGPPAGSEHRPDQLYQDVADPGQHRDEQQDVKSLVDRVADSGEVS